MSENSTPEASAPKYKTMRRLDRSQMKTVIDWATARAEELHDKSTTQLMTLLSNGVGFPVSDKTVPYICECAGVRLKVRPKPAPRPVPEPLTLEDLAARLDRSEKAFASFKADTQQHIARLASEIQSLKAPSLPLDIPPSIVPGGSPS